MIGSRVSAKICGLRTKQDVASIVSFGARYAGFVFYDPSPRAIVLDAAKTLVSQLPEYIVPVGVFVDPNDDDLINAVMELTLGKGVDYAFDAVGNSELIALGLTVSRAGGSTVIVGAPPPDEELKFSSALHLMMTEKRLLGSLLGSCNAQEDIPLLIDYWQKGLLDLENMISQTYPLGDINSGIADLRNSIGIRSVIKIHEN